MSDPSNSDHFLDPFWEVLHRRHPDVDIVLLPPPPAETTPAARTSKEPQPFAESNTAAAQALWERIVGSDIPQHLARWVPGPISDSLRHTVTLTRDNVSEGAGREHMLEAESLLQREAWQIFAPPVGTPRINAERLGPDGSEQLLVGYMPDAQRMFLRLTSPALSLDSDQILRLIGTTS